MSDKTAQGSGAPPTRAQAGTAKIEQVAADEAQSLVRQLEWRVLVAVATLIAHEAAIFSWKRMTGQPPPTHRGRIRGL